MLRVQSSIYVHRGAFGIVDIEPFADNSRNKSHRLCPSSTASSGLVFLKQKVILIDRQEVKLHFSVRN